MTQIELRQIRFDGGTQPRADQREDVIAEYVEALVNGAMFPPVDVTDDGESYWLTDGFHRVSAARRAGKVFIQANVTQGTLADAQWRSLSVNQTHGLRRTTADKKRAIEAVLRHPNGAGKSDRSIADYLGVDHKTVAKVRIDLSVSGEIPQMENRQVTRSGTTYTQNTAGISAPRPPVRYATDDFGPGDDFDPDDDANDDDDIDASGNNAVVRGWCKYCYEETEWEPFEDHHRCLACDAIADPLPVPIHVDAKENHEDEDDLFWCDTCGRKTLHAFPGYGSVCTICDAVTVATETGSVRLPYSELHTDAESTVVTRQAVSANPDYDGDEWYTPADIVEVSRKVLGDIDIDPASCESAQRVVRASQYFTKDDDGLSRSWGGRVFVNPPYSQPSIGQFVKKFINEYRSGRMVAGIILVNNCTETGWFTSLAESFALMFGTSRIKFYNPNYADNFQTRQGQALFYAGPLPEVFFREFLESGLAYAPNRRIE